MKVYMVGSLDPKSAVELAETMNGAPLVILTATEDEARNAGGFLYGEHVALVSRVAVSLLASDPTEVK